MTRLKKAWLLLNASCQEMTRLASESLDRDLGAMERVALKSHLLYCASCRRYARQVVLVTEALRRLGSRIESHEDLPGPGLSDDVRERIKRALDEQ